MIAFPWEEEASRGMPAPRGLPLREIEAYHSLCYLYGRFFTKQIDRETAATEKQTIWHVLCEREREEKYAERLAEYYVHVIKATERARIEYRKAATNEERLRAASTLVRAIDNIPVPDIGGKDDECEKSMDSNRVDRPGGAGAAVADSCGHGAAVGDEKARGG